MRAPLQIPGGGGGESHGCVRKTKDRKPLGYPRGQGNAQIQRFLFPSVQGGYGTLGVTLVRSQLRTDPRLQIVGRFFAAVVLLQVKSNTNKALRRRRRL